MERVSGGDLQVYFNRYSLSERQVALVMHQLLQAINYLSRHGIVHRDIKPQNILVEVVPNTKKIINIKLTDFGLSKIVKPGETMMGSCGTPQYIAPDILLNQGYDKQIDMWSCGVLFYQLVCGTLPFKSKNK